MDTTNSSDSDSDREIPVRQTKKPQPTKKEDTSSSSDSDSSEEDEDLAPKKHSASSTPSSTPASKPSTAVPPVRPAAHTAQYSKGGQVVTGKDGKVLTKQQINQIAAREKQKAEAERKMRQAIASGMSEEEARKLANQPVSKKQKKEEEKKKQQQQQQQQQSQQSEESSKKRKKPDSSDNDSDSDSGSDEEAPHRKAAKVSAGADAASSKEAPVVDRSGRVDTTGMTPKEAKAAIVAAKRAARALKKEKTRSEAEAKGIHPTQRELQLMNRDLQAEKLWELYSQDRKERGSDLTPLEQDEHLRGFNLAQIPDHENMDSHSFKMLSKHLKSMYGSKYQEQVLGGVIQPALSTKQERLDKKKDKRIKKQEGKEEEIEEEELDDIKQKQEHMDNPNIGAPYIVFISPSAIRAVECGRGFKQIPMNTRVVKLFAKHLKVDQQREELSHDVRVAIGTPHRLLTLSQNGFLKWNRVRLIVWDIGKTRKLQVAESQEKRRVKNKIKAGKEVEDPLTLDLKKDSHDRKMFTLLELKDVKSELWKLYEQYLHEVVVKKQTAKLVLL